ncbi:hypothetical protein Leryth_011684 [Lithospermum erythrorhizon]|nr:hypothetical protein Leryth_011684 [Lithospermum erythrorhizon]
MVVANVTRNIEISSNGVWEGDNPLDYAFPLLIAQTTLNVFIFPSLRLFRHHTKVNEILSLLLLVLSRFFVASIS